MLLGLFHQSRFWIVAALVGFTILAVFLSIKLLPSIFRRIAAYDKKPGEVLVALLGDSITEGKVGESYVSLLEKRFNNQNHSFLNAGVAADTAYNLLNRLEPVVTSKPDYVVILIGTDDVEAYLRGGYLPKIIQWVKKLPQPVTPDWFASLLRQIVKSLQKRTSARISLCSIPILGEDIESTANQAVQLFNRSIKALAEELQITYLPVYETMKDYLQRHQEKQGKAFDEASSNSIMFWAVWDHNILGRNWDDISTQNNLLLTVDTEHFNHRGATIIADLMEGWLRQQAV